MNLVAYHVLQTLVVSRTKENHYFQLFASKSVVHYFISVTLVTQLVKRRTDIINALTLEGGCITLVSIQRSYFTKNTLNQMANRHSRRNSMRIDNHVRYDPL